MVAYSFQRRFAPPILAGTKRQTIRAPRQRQTRPGEMLQLYIGLRTRECRLIALTRCQGVEPVVLNFAGNQVRYGLSADSWVFDFEMGHPFCDELARRDGFTDWPDLAAFWREHYPGVNRFEGEIIRWGDLLRPIQQPGVAHA